jgi:ribulose-phosphate 3-epimerase
MVEVSSSILSVKKGEEAEVFLNLEKSKTDYFHIDVMDGKFVEKNTYKNMQEYVSYIRRISSLPIDVHLMVEDIKQAIDDFSMVEPNIITFHIEACKDEQEVFEIISLIKETHARVGISVKPDTDVEKIYKFLPYVHVDLIMTVEPGKGGQTLLVDMLEKIKKIKEYILKENLDVDIEADGGINLSNSEKVKNAGADILVAGTAILSATDYKNIIQELKA